MLGIRCFICRIVYNHWWTERNIKWKFKGYNIWLNCFFKIFKISRSDMMINVYLGIIGMIVDPGLVTDGSANDAIPPTRGFWNFVGSFSDGEFGWMTFVLRGDKGCWVGDVGSFTKACVVVLFVLEGICVSYMGIVLLGSETLPVPVSWEGFSVCNWCRSPKGVPSD